MKNFMPLMPLPFNNQEKLKQMRLESQARMKTNVQKRKMMTLLMNIRREETSQQKMN